MIGTPFLLLAAAAPAEVRFALEASPTEVFFAHPSPAAAILAIRPPTGGGPFYLALEPGGSALLAVPEGIETDGFAFDYATAEGIAVCCAPLFAEGGRTRTSLVLVEPDSATFALVAAESETPGDSTGGSSWNLTIGPPPRNPKAAGTGDGLLCPNGGFGAEPAFQPVAGYHSPF
ncbi:MAG TPA: hypothetical protein VFI25_09770 [Planctomycetota bacterium]|jgi:hypothetical protein|nr:hypothetical protein [Planctomycetota bacterium]